MGSVESKPKEDFHPAIDRHISKSSVKIENTKQQNESNFQESNSIKSVVENKKSLGDDINSEIPEWLFKSSKTLHVDLVNKGNQYSCIERGICLESNKETVFDKDELSLEILGGNSSTQALKQNKTIEECTDFITEIKSDSLQIQSKYPEGENVINSTELHDNSNTFKSATGINIKKNISSETVLLCRSKENLPTPTSDIDVEETVFDKDELSLEILGGNSSTQALKQNKTIEECTDFITEIKSDSLQIQSKYLEGENVINSTELHDNSNTFKSATGINNKKNIFSETVLLCRSKENLPTPTSDIDSSEHNIPQSTKVNFVSRNEFEDTVKCSNSLPLEFSTDNIFDYLSEVYSVLEKIQSSTVCNVNIDNLRDLKKKTSSFKRLIEKRKYFKQNIEGDISVKGSNTYGSDEVQKLNNLLKKYTFLSVELNPVFYCTLCKIYINIDLRDDYTGVKNHMESVVHNQRQIDLNNKFQNTNIPSIIKQLPIKYAYLKDYFKIEEQVLKCMLCGETLSFESIHIINHFEKENHKGLYSKQIENNLQENGKNVTDGSNNNLCDSKSTISTETLLYICCVCDFVTRKIEIWKNHLKAECDNNDGKFLRSFVCESCKMVLFGDKFTWKEHCLLRTHKHLATDTNKTVLELNSLEEDSYDVLLPENFRKCKLSKNDRNSLQEIFLSKIAKTCDINNTSTKGFICFLCGIYLFYGPNKIEHSDLHVDSGTNIPFHYRKITCKSCNIDMYCDTYLGKRILKDHLSSPNHELIAKTMGYDPNSPDLISMGEKTDCKLSLNTEFNIQNTEVTDNLKKFDKDKNKSEYEKLDINTSSVQQEDSLTDMTSEVDQNNSICKQNKYAKDVSKISSKSISVKSITELTDERYLVTNKENILADISSLENPVFPHEFDYENTSTVKYEKSVIDTTSMIGDREKSKEIEIHSLNNSVDEDVSHKNMMLHIANTFFKIPLLKLPYIIAYMCEICKESFVDEGMWKVHINGKDHKDKGVCGDVHFCNICRILFLCSDEYFNKHVLSFEHCAIEKHFIINENGEEKQKGNVGELNHEAVGKKKPIALIVQGYPANTKIKNFYDIFHKFGLQVKYVEMNYKKKQDSALVFFSRPADIETLLESNQPLKIGENVLQISYFFSRKGGKSQNFHVSANLNKLFHSPSVFMGVVDRIIIRYTAIANKESLKTQQVLDDIKNALKNTNVYPFGSRMYGTSSETSDLDVFVDIDGSYFDTSIEENPKREKKIMRRIADDMRRYNRVKKCVMFSNILFIPARVPIVRLIHQPTYLSCDLSCKNGLSVENTMLTKCYLDSNPRVAWLVTAIKYWANINSLKDSSKFTSYGLTWMVLYFLMQLNEPVIFPVETLRSLPSSFKLPITGWNCQFCSDVNLYPKSKNTQLVLELLHDFFVFYATLDHENYVLCPIIGSKVSKKKFLKLDLPKCFQSYVDRFNATHEHILLKKPLCLQDPFDLGHNLTKNVTTDCLHHFKNLCIKSAKMCEQW